VTPSNAPGLRERAALWVEISLEAVDKVSTLNAIQLSNLERQLIVTLCPQPDGKDFN
jgi:hypothetical protein